MPLDPAQLRRSAIDRAGRLLMPLAVGLVVLGLWQWLVTAYDIKPYILPGPMAIIRTLIKDWALLSASLVTTLKITLLALLAAVIGGVGLAVLFTSSRWVELAFFPYAVILQVTPIVAIAPLILIYVENIVLALLICAWVVAFFPILSNMTLGLNSVDENLRALFRLYRAGPWRTLWLLRLPSAMPYFLGGLRIAGGLALIGAVVAEFAAGTGGTGSGLAYRILESSYRLNIPRMYAALVLISAAGIALYLLFSWLAWLVLRHWHESAIKRDF